MDDTDGDTIPLSTCTFSTQTWRNSILGSTGVLLRALLGPALMFQSLFPLPRATTFPFIIQLCLVETIPLCGAVFLCFFVVQPVCSICALGSRLGDGAAASWWDGGGTDSGAGGHVLEAT